MKKLLGLISVFFLCAGCITIPVSGKIEPLKETVVKKGDGTGKIAVVRIDGVITDMSKRGLMGDELEVSMPVRLKEELDIIRKDDSVKGVILRIDSPGGGVSTCDTMYNEIMKFKKEKKVPVVVEMAGIAASGGVYLAAAGDKIIANPTTVTGSIGVIAQTFRIKDLLDKIGVSSEVIKSGDKKDMGSLFRSMTDEERAIFQDVINTMYERFLSVVLDGRKNLDEKKLRSFADGRIFTSKKALEYGLIDSIGYTDDVILETEKMAGISKAEIVIYSRPGRYTPNIYSGKTDMNSMSLGAVNISLSAIEESLGCRFLYQMMP